MEKTWDDEQKEAMKHFEERFQKIRESAKDRAHIRAVDMNEPEWLSAIGAVILYSPLIVLAIANFL